MTWKTVEEMTPDQRLAYLLGRSSRDEEVRMLRYALERIAEMDYRGNVPPEHEIAQKALR